LKKYMIRCDIEGVTGVVSYEQAEPGKPEYNFGQQMFMSDLLALLHGLNDAGADQIVIYDEHYYGRNIEMDKLPDNVSAICGKPPYQPGWSGGLDDSFAGVILLGFHSKFNNYGGLLHHSYELDIQDLRLNGISVGEIGMEAAVAGDHGVPVQMITADSEGISEAETLLPGIKSVCVKQSLSDEGAECFPTSLTSKQIKETAMSIVTDPPTVKPFTLGPEVKLEIDLNPGNYLTAFHEMFRNDMTSDNSIEIIGSTATEVWGDYWQKKLNCQQKMQEA
jgi:D-amino peptidase